MCMMCYYSTKRCLEKLIKLVNAYYIDEMKCKLEAQRDIGVRRQNHGSHSMTMLELTKIN
jgi:hypothetical protein